MMAAGWKAILLVAMSLIELSLCQTDCFQQCDASDPLTVVGTVPVGVPAYECCLDSGFVALGYDIGGGICGSCDPWTSLLPVSHIIESPMPFVLGQPYTAKCVISIETPAGTSVAMEAEWVDANGNVVVSDTTVATFDDVSYTCACLTFDPLDASSAGTYDCRTSFMPPGGGDFMIMEQMVDIHVLEIGTSDPNPDPGDPVTITCTINGLPSTTVTSLMLCGPDGSVISSSTTNTLSFPIAGYVPDANSGTYTCKSDDSIPTSTSLALPAFTVPPFSCVVTPPGTIVEGTTVTLQCSGSYTPSLPASAQASVALSWTTPTSTTSGSTITIPNFSMNDLGIYTCQCNPMSPFLTLAGASSSVELSNLEICMVGTSVGCNENAMCISTLVSGMAVAQCQCNTGFSGDGQTCQDVNECDASPSPCDANAQCTNTISTFTCTCNDGYEGDGFTCSLVLPVTSVPTTQSPTNPTTQNPTTANPATQNPTTATQNPTTQSPTTEEPTDASKSRSKSKSKSKKKSKSSKKSKSESPTEVAADEEKSGKKKKKGRGRRFFDI